MPISIGGGSGGNVWYDPATGILYYGSTPISYETVTYAQLMDSGFDVATERTVHVSDKHSTIDGTSEPGSFWRIIPSAASTYKRQLISGPVYCANEAAAPTASNHPGLEIFDAGLGPNGCYRYSDGTGYLTRQGQVVHRDTVRVGVVCPDTATFGTANVDNNGGYARLTGAGNHGLTQAVCVTAGVSYINVTGGTAGLSAGLHQIRSVSDGTAVLTLETAYSSTGTATVTLSNSGTDIVCKTITLPRLSSNSRVTTRVATSHPSTATNKNFKLKLGGTSLYSPTFNALGASNGAEYTFVNRGSVSSQRATTGYLAPTGLGASSVAGSTAAIDTSTGTAQITLSYSPVTANEVCAVEMLDVVVS